MPVTVSVILPVFNRPDSLFDACRSVLDQSYRDLELIVVDDASTEDLVPVVDKVGDARLRYVRRETNGGAAAARNTGLEIAEGRLIAFQDSDDLWLPGKLERQVARLAALPKEVGVVTGAKILYGGGPARDCGHGRVTYAPPAGRWLTLDEDQVRRFLTENRISLQNALFRRDCYPEPLWFDPRAKANNDWEFTIRLVQHTKICEDPEPVVLSFISNDSISRDPRKKISGRLRILKKNRQLFERYPDAYGENRYTLGRWLWRIGKRRAGRRFILQALRDAPGLKWRILRSLQARILQR